MKQNIGPGVLIGVVVVVLVIVGVVAYRMFLTDPNYTPLKGEKAMEEFRKAQSNDATAKRLSAHGGRGH